MGRRRQASPAAHPGLASSPIATGRALESDWSRSERFQPNTAKAHLSLVAVPSFAARPPPDRA